MRERRPLPSGRAHNQRERQRERARQLVRDAVPHCECGTSFSNLVVHAPGGTFENQFRCPRCGTIRQFTRPMGRHECVIVSR